METATLNDYEKLLEAKDSMSGMFLTFELGNEGYGLEIRHVIEIIGVQKVTCVPDMPEHVIGVLNLRGKVIPIIDVRIRFNLKGKEYDDRTCIIVVDVEGASVGLVVDKVNEVVDIPEKSIEPPPLCSKTTNQFIQGLGKIEEQVKILLDIERLLGEDQLTEAIDEGQVA